jgi:ribosomal-protein-alanine N-acetyltransferase
MHARPPFWHGPYLITAGTEEDLPAIAALEMVVFPEPMALAALRHLFRLPSTHVLVARRDGQVCAYHGFEVHGPTAWVLANATDPDHRRRGLATALILAGEAEARRAGARWLVGVVRYANIVQMRLLAELGWQTVGLCTRYFGNGEDAWMVYRCLD